MWKWGPKSRRINLVGILAAILTLASLGLSWWGIDVHFSGTLTWGPLVASSPSPGTVFFDPDKLSTGFLFYGQLMVLLVLGTSVLAGLGSFLKSRIVLATGLVLSILTALLFLVDVNFAVGQACAGFQPPPVDCISGLSGSGAVSGSTVNWGFQSGYYLFLVSTFVLAAGLLLHKSSITLRLTRESIE